MLVIIMYEGAGEVDGIQLVYRMVGRWMDGDGLILAMHFYFKDVEFFDISYLFEIWDQNSL